MALLNIDKQFVKQTILDISQTERAFDECRSKVHRGLRIFLETSILICQLLRDCFKQELRDIEAKGITVDYIRFCQKYQKLQRELHSYVIKFMPTISEHEYPPEIVRPIEQIIRQFEKDFTLVIHPCDGRTFVLTAQPDMFKYYVDSLSPYVPTKYLKKNNKCPKWFIFLSFPRALSRNPLLHSITVSHEVLHLKDHIEGISASISNQVIIPKARFNELVKEILDTKIPVPGWESMLMPRTYSEFYSREVLESAVMKKCTDVIEVWIAEIVADLLAVRMFGPAYLLASAEHSLALGVMDSDSDSHPNSRMRLKIMMRELRELGYLRKRKHNTEIVEILRMWNSYVQTKVTPDQEPIHSVAASSISKSRAKLTQRVREVTRGMDYTAGQFHREVWDLVNLINNGIPPCELIDVRKKESKPPSLAGILNAGYMSYLYGLDKLRVILGKSGEKGEIESRRKLDELLFKAIESTYAWKAWPS